MIAKKEIKQLLIKIHFIDVISVNKIYALCVKISTRKNIP